MSYCFKALELQALFSAFSGTFRQFSNNQTAHNQIYSSVSPSLNEVNRIRWSFEICPDNIHACDSFRSISKCLVLMQPQKHISTDWDFFVLRYIISFESESCIASLNIIHVSRLWAFDSFGIGSFLTLQVWTWIWDMKYSGFIFLKANPKISTEG